LQKDKTKIGIVIPITRIGEGGTHTFSTSIFNELLEFDVSGKNFEITIIHSGDIKKLHEYKFTKNGITLKRLNLTYKSNLVAILFNLFKSYIQLIYKPFNQPSISESFCQVVSDKLAKTGLDVFWFVTPPPIFINLPFVAPVYNLAHREFPYLSEFSDSGEFVARETYYKNVLDRAFKVVFTHMHHASNAINLYNFDGNKAIIQPLPTPKDILENEKWDNAVPKKYGINLKEPYFIYPANFWKHKNHFFLVQVFKQVVEQKKGIQLVLTGSDKGELDRIRILIRNLKMESNILILNHVERTDLLQLIKFATAVLFPSLIGPDSIPKSESLALSVPFFQGKFSKENEVDNSGGLEISLHDTSKWVDSITNISELKFNTIFRGQGAYTVTSREYLNSLISQIVTTLK